MLFVVVATFLNSGMATGQTAKASLNTTYQAVRASVVADYGPGDIGLNGDPAAGAKLDKAWTLIADWAADYLTNHPSATPDDFQKGILAFDPGLDMTQMFRLGPHSYLVGVEWQDDILGGNLFIVGPGTNGNRLGVLWNIKDATASSPQASNIIAAWSPSAIAACNNTGCGPMMELAGILPATASGNARFFLRGIHAGDMPFYQTGQLSIWQWDGHAAVPILIQRYQWVPAADSSIPVFNGRYLRLDVMTEYQNFETWPIAARRKAQWMIDIQPSSIKDAGTVATVWELDLLDMLLGQMKAKAGISSLASPQVTTVMSALLTERGLDGEPAITHRLITINPDKSETLCVTFQNPTFSTTHNYGGPDQSYILKIVSHAQSHYFASAVEKNADVCTD